MRPTRSNPWQAERTALERELAELRWDYRQAKMNLLKGGAALATLTVIGVFFYIVGGVGNHPNDYDRIAFGILCAGGIGYWLFMAIKALGLRARIGRLSQHSSPSGRIPSNR